MGYPVTSPELIKRIIFLRKRGYSLPEISREVGIPKTTIFRYVSGVKIMPKYGNIWKIKRGGSRKRKQLREEAAMKEALQFGSLSEREGLLFISALYWGEGSKKDFGLSNTDPRLIRVFVASLRQLLGISDERLRVSVRIYEDLDRDKCLEFWSGIVGIPKENFVSVNVLQGKKKGKLEYGMCRVRVKKGGDLLKKFVSINRVIADSCAPVVQQDRILAS